jgi:hypothetical protein
MTVSKQWCNLNIDTHKPKDLNFTFANHREEKEIYPLTTIVIAQAQHKDRELKVYYKKNARMPKEDMCFQFIMNAKVLCKKANLRFLHLYDTELLLGTTTTSNTLVTRVSKRQ